ncbi:hypothetical protein LIER_40733 [Lithospermum erythrorhizon]|uniref:Uncharacterized protein n=1 Tax=Lithospermum erythrorhizon TaxID=34254 RepID=A0AAV3QZ23_LITER
MSVFKWGIAQAIGRPICVDPRNVNRSILNSARVCVELDVSKPLLDAIWLCFEDEAKGTLLEGFWLLQAACYHIGHDLNKCKRRRVEGEYISREEDRVAGQCLTNCLSETTAKFAPNLVVVAGIYSNMHGRKSSKAW